VNYPSLLEHHRDPACLARARYRFRWELIEKITRRRLKPTELTNHLRPSECDLLRSGQEELERTTCSSPYSPKLSLCGPTLLLETRHARRGLEPLPSMNEGHSRQLNQPTIVRKGASHSFIISSRF
jgi:hypothetical protein